MKTYRAATHIGVGNKMPDYVLEGCGPDVEIKIHFENAHDSPTPTLSPFRWLLLCSTRRPHHGWFLTRGLVYTWDQKLYQLVSILVHKKVLKGQKCQTKSWPCRTIQELFSRKRTRAREGKWRNPLYLGNKGNKILPMLRYKIFDVALFFKSWIYVQFCNCQLRTYRVHLDLDSRRKF